VVFQLIHAVGVAQREVMLMTRDEAIARLNAYWRNRPVRPGDSAAELTVPPS
jgi:hypothetical protein